MKLEDNGVWWLNDVRGWSIHALDTISSVFPQRYRL